MISSRLDKIRKIFTFESNFENENVALVSPLELIECYLNSIIIVAKNEPGNTNKIVKDMSNNFVDKLKDEDYIDDTKAMYDWFIDEEDITSLEEENKDLGYLLLLMNLMSNELKNDPDFQEVNEAIKKATKDSYGIELDHDALFSLLDMNKICEENEDRYDDLIYKILEQEQEIDDDEIEEEL